MKQDPFKILGFTVKPGETSRAFIEIAKLHSNTPVQIPLIISHSKKKGPVLLLLGGVHGDEINGVEIIRRIIKNNWHQPKKGTLIFIPIFNFFGFLNLTREFPDGRDLNRMFPGTKNGSLASQFAHLFMNEIAPLVDLVLDFHTGGSKRSNYPQTRCDFNNKDSKELCDIFSAPFTIDSPVLSKSIRSEFTKLGKRYLIYEGGKAQDIDEYVVETGITGVKRVMSHLGLRNFNLEAPKKNYEIKQSKWIRASRSGMLNVKIENGIFVEKGKILATISDPYGRFERSIKAPFNGLIFNVNETPIVNKGDALFNIGRWDKKQEAKEKQE